MSHKTIRLDKSGPVARLTLNRPEALNALDHAAADEILSALEALEADPEVRAVVVTGEGKHFCSGGDIKAMATALPDHPTHFFEKELQVLHRAVLKIRRSRKPFIASVRGHTAGAGFSLALTCDFRVVSETARFTMAFVRLGLAPDSGGSYLLTRLVGEARAKYLCLTGETIDAWEADRIGLATRLVPDADLQKATDALAAALAAAPPLALAQIKSLIQASWDGILDDQLDRETDAQIALGRTEDFQEGIRAFLEKRPPVFKGK